MNRQAMNNSMNRMPPTVAKVRSSKYIPPPSIESFTGYSPQKIKQSHTSPKRQPPAFDDAILAALDPAEREAFSLEKQRQIMEEIEKQKKDNDVSSRVARTMAYNQRSCRTLQSIDETSLQNKSSRMEEMSMEDKSSALLDPAEREALSLEDQRQIMEQIEKQKKDDDASTISAREKTFNQRRPASVAQLTASCRNLEFIEGTPMQIKLSYNELSMADNGSIINDSQKYKLREKLGYCLQCRHLPTLLYKVKKNNFNPFKTTKEARAVAGQCAGGICFICHPDKDPITRCKRLSFRLSSIAPTPPPPGRKTVRASSTRNMEGLNY